MEDMGLIEGLIATLRFLLWQCLRACPDSKSRQEADSAGGPLVHGHIQTWQTVIKSTYNIFHRDIHIKSTISSGIQWCKLLPAFDYVIGISVTKVDEYLTEIPHNFQNINLW